VLSRISVTGEDSNRAECTEGDDGQGFLLAIPEGQEISIKTTEKDFSLHEGICEEMQEGKSVLVFIDTSGSMKENNRLENAKSAALRAVRILGENDEVALVTFGDDLCSIRTVHGFTSDKELILNRIASIGITAYSGTPLAKAIRQTSQYLRENSSRSEMSLILLTDGMDGCGSGRVESPEFEIARHKRRKAEGTIREIKMLAVDEQGEPVSDSSVEENGKVMVRVVYKRPPELDETTIWLTSSENKSEKDKVLVPIKRHEKYSCVFQSAPVQVKPK
jgi:hypothetical protein